MTPTSEEKAKAWLLAWAVFLTPPALVYAAVFFWWAPAFLPPHKRLFDVESDIAFGVGLTLAHIALSAGLYWLLLVAKRGYDEGLKRAAVNPPPDAYRRRIRHNDEGDQSPTKIRERLMERWLWYS